MELHLPKNFGTIIIILHGVLHKAEPIDIAHKGVAVGSEEVETAHRLLWRQDGLGQHHNTDDRLKPHQDNARTCLVTGGSLL